MLKKWAAIANVMSDQSMTTTVNEVNDTILIDIRCLLTVETDSKDSKCREGAAWCRLWGRMSAPWAGGSSTRMVMTGTHLCMKMGGREQRSWGSDAGAKGAPLRSKGFYLRLEALASSEPKLGTHVALFVCYACRSVPRTLYALRNTSSSIPIL